MRPLFLFVLLLCFYTSSAQFEHYRNKPPKTEDFEFAGDIVNFRIDKLTAERMAKDNKRLDSVFNISADYDFEFRLWTRYLSSNFDYVFVLTFNKGSLSARYFTNSLAPVETKLDQTNVNQLWYLLKDNNILTLPDESLLKDKLVRYVVDTAYLPNVSQQHKVLTDGIMYTFELRTPRKAKLYNYGCPNFYLKEYGNVKELSDVVILIALIEKFMHLPVFIC